MKLPRRILCAALSAALCLSLSACGTELLKKGEAEPTPTPTAMPDATPTPAPTPQPTPVPPVQTTDMVEKLLGFPRSTAVLTVNGAAVNAEDFLYVLAYLTEAVGAEEFDGVESIDWDAQVEETPIKTYLLDAAVEQASFYAVVRQKAADNGIALDESERAALEADVQQVIANLGGSEAYARQLESLGLSDEGLRSMWEFNTIYEKLQDKLYGAESGNMPGEEELAKFAEDVADALLAKHILIKTVDDANQPLPEDEQAAAKAKAEDILSQLRASSDPLTLFDQLMNEHSQDGRDADGRLYSADGYFFTANDMVAEFEMGTRGLEYNEISDLVKTTYGYHIILRLPPVNDEVRAAWSSNAMGEAAEEWVHSAAVETADEFTKIDPQTYYEGLAAHREELNPPLES